ncbi:putative Exonuclease [Leishmania naiffi]|uniref:Exonuclease n=1 Tax=Leishmania naiffi TaxID=5678 RepID=A0AAW3C932_9TRYP
MSALMEHPPEATKIAQYRASMKAATALTLSTPPAEAPPEPTADATTGPKGSVQYDVSITSPPTGKGGSTAFSHSFLEAVLNGRAKPTRALAPGTPLAHPKAMSDTLVSGSPLALHTASSSNGARTDQHSVSPGVDTASKATEMTSAQPSARKMLELVPGDAATIPELLSALREIALSCASLDTLDKAAAGPGSFSEGAAAASPHPKPVRSTDVPVMAAVARDAGSGGAGTASGSRSAAVPAVVTPAHPSHDLGTTEEEHWDHVRAHFEVVRKLVLNEHELTRALDEALGAEWRRASTPLVLQGYEKDVVVARSNNPPAVPVDGAHSTLAAALSGTPAAATACSVVPAMPEPAKHEAPPTPSSAGRTLDGPGAPRTSTATSAAITSTPTTTDLHTGTNATGVACTTSAASPATTLSYRARLFHGRTPPSVQQQQQRRSVSFSPAAPSSVTDSRAASTNNAASSSMKQLSENSATYSPSQHVAMMLDRGVTPAAAALRTQDEGEAGLLNFPSTPLSEAAVPYQPSASLMNTSPRGCNAVTSSSAPFHLETREEMLRRRSAAPNAFYASMSHSAAAHFLGRLPSAATTPSTFMSSTLAPGVPPFSLNGSAGGACSVPVSPLLSYTSPLGVLPCPYEYLLVLDFEATCEEHPPHNYLHEIIEFPVVVVDVRLQRIVAEFHRFVRPRYKRELSSFCKRLTGMRQEDVDTAASLEEVILQFERWFSHTLPQHARCVFVTDGPMDLREFMYHHSVSRQGIRFPPLFYQFIDVKQTFACFFRCSQGKIKAMLEVLHLPFEGRLHSGLDDARNIASIVIGLLHYGCTFCEVPLNRLPFNGLLLTGASSVGGSAPLALPPSTASAASCCTRLSDASPTAISAPSSATEDDHSC